MFLIFGDLHLSKCSAAGTQMNIAVAECRWENGYSPA